MTEIVHQWAPERGFVSRVLPATSDSWSPTSSVVARYLLSLSALGIEDPTWFRKHRASDFYAQALALRDHSIAFASKHDGEADIANRLAMGEIDSEQAAKLLAKTPTASEEQEQAERGRRMLADATRAAYTAAVRAIHNYGDKWLDLLRPKVQEAVAAQDQARWDALHAFAALLRHRDLAALAIVASDTNGFREFEETWRYAVGKPHLYHLWRLEHADDAYVQSHDIAGPFVFVASAIRKGPHPRLADMDPTWEMGLYSAAEVISIKDRIVAEQEAVRMDAEPPAPRSRRAVTS